jgi:F420H(2)-dependent quinone reductase
MVSPLLKRLRRTFTRFHIFVYRISSGKIGGKMIGPPVLLLTTTGRKTGQPRTTPVSFIHENGEYLIAASASGSTQNPTWLANLESKPEATIEIKGKQIEVKAVITSGDERDKLYALFTANYASFIWVEKRAARKIPVVRLLPIRT